MRKLFIAFASIFIYNVSFAQADDLVPVAVTKSNVETPIAKKLITHDVYDRWESLGERAISNNGKYLMYTVNPQEGDGNLYLSTPNGRLEYTIPRGYNAIFSTNNSYIYGKIKPFFKETREAKIKKKRPDEMPKDTFFIYNIANKTIEKIVKVKTFKAPEKSGEWLAYLMEKAEAPKPKTVVAPDSLTQVNALMKMADSLRKVADSLILKTTEAKLKGLAVLIPPKKEVKPAAKPEDPIEEGTDLILRNTINSKEKIFKLVSEYYFDKYGKKLLVETSKKIGDSTKKAMVYWYDLQTEKADTVLVGFNDAKNYAISENANQLAFVVEKDSAAKALQKFYKLYHFKSGEQSAKLIADRNSANVKKGLTVSPDFVNNFSKNEENLYFGLAPIRKPKDTTLVDFETARLDIWNYKDDYLQPQQLVALPQELRKSYTSVYHVASNQFNQIATDTTENIVLIDEGNSDKVLAISNKGNRASGQWLGFGNTSSYIVNTVNGATTPITKNERANVSISPKGKFAFWYDYKLRNWITFNTATNKKSIITKGIKVLYDEDDDHPDAPPPHGIMRWAENEEFLYVYDKYDIWKCDPNGINAPKQITNGRKQKIITRWANTDFEERFISKDKEYLFTYFDENTKKSDIQIGKVDAVREVVPNTSTTFRGFLRAKDSLNCFMYSCENPQSSPYIVSYVNKPQERIPYDVNIIHQPNKQQEEYNWYTTELINWKMFDGKMSEGILYKPENFDPKKKYPIIFYFYEKDANDLYTYKTPAPSASTVNIPYFVSNGYLVFDPNIYYKDGEPGESAYNSVVSAAKYLSKKYSFVDSTKMAIQGQSWGGYQVAYLVTRTNMFACAGAGAAVSNMTSAYGGIRWGAGISRQFQYERGQTRIGGDLWNKRDLYIKNSPLFFVDKIKTPLLLMHNDKDGAVPWYQGIEFFSALKRLDKKAWLLQYNDEDHNLIERRNRKDLSVRLGQFFDVYLKGKPMPVWMKDGVQAVDKGIEWGLGY